MTIENIRLEKTCEACPEQYDAFIGDKQVGYLRLRWGTFTVNYPDVKGEEIYSAEPEGDGMFEEEERSTFLEQAKMAILNKINEAQFCKHCGNKI